MDRTSFVYMFEEQMLRFLDYKAVKLMMLISLSRSFSVISSIDARNWVRNGNGRGRRVRQDIGRGWDDRRLFFVHERHQQELFLCEKGFWSGKTPTTARFQRPGGSGVVASGVAAHRPTAAKVMKAKSDGSPTISSYFACRRDGEGYRRKGGNTFQRKPMTSWQHRGAPGGGDSVRRMPSGLKYTSVCERMPSERMRRFTSSVFPSWAADMTEAANGRDSASLFKMTPTSFMSVWAVTADWEKIEGSIGGYCLAHADGCGK